MLHALSCVLALAQGLAPVHADLHPREADLYFELSDVQGLLDAYEHAPLIELTKDERLEDLWSEAGLEDEIGARRLLGWAWSELFPDTPEVLGTDALRTLSFSLLTEEEGKIAFLLVAEFREPAQAETFAAAVQEGHFGRVADEKPVTSALPGVVEFALWKTRQRAWCATSRARFVLGAGAAQPGDFAGRLEKGEGFDESAILRKGKGSLTPGPGQIVFWFALSRSMMHPAAASGSPADVYARELRVLPLDFNPFDRACVGRMRLANGRFHTEVFMPDEPGVEPSAFGRAPIERAWLEPVPSDAMLVYTTSLDGEALGRRLRTLLEADTERAARLKEIEERLGFGFERPFSALGPGLAFSMASLVALRVPGTRLWVDCTDPEAFRAGIEAWFGALGETLPDFGASTKPQELARGRTTERVELPVTTLSWPKGLIGALPSTLAFASVGRKIVFALRANELEEELKRHHREGNAAAPDPFVAHGFSVPDEARSALVVDWARFLTSLSALAQTFGLFVDLPFDVEVLPPSGIYAEYFRPTFHLLARAPGGILRVNEASFAGELWIAALAVPLAMAGRTAAAEENARAASADSEDR